jgi:arabinogalactan endo-1,4-beta-galactosidase
MIAVIKNKHYIMKLLILFLVITLALACSKDNTTDEIPDESNLVYGGDFSIIKKMEDYGAVYKVNGVANDGLQIFKANGYTWARFRIFHTPDFVGPVCNDLNYTIASAKKAKSLGFKILLDFHYSDTWADPGKQFTPAAWKNLTIQVLSDSVRVYTTKVLDAMQNAGVLPEMVQIGNEINNGMLWPLGKLWPESGGANWQGLTQLVKAGIQGVKQTKNSAGIKIMIHAATGGKTEESNTFFQKMIEYGIEFDVIGLSYYPWWHGTLNQLEANLVSLSNKFAQDISLVETAYYSNNWYPDPGNGVLNYQPYPPTEQGQYDYLVELAKRLKNHPKVKSVFYWEPEALDIPESKIFYLGRSIFDKQGNAFKGITAWLGSK